jgi:transcription initiation factor TFIIIB Brf1 subunit/transcription initiation factor TFIIB
MERNQLPLLVTTATIMAAKMEQPMTPSIKRMIKLLTLEEQSLVDKEGVIQLEQRVLTDLSFDFNYPSPLPFLERFMRLCELHKDEEICEQAVELLKIASSRIVFLDFRPSNIAASALILSLCLYELAK